MKNKIQSFILGIVYLSIFGLSTMSCANKPKDGEKAPKQESAVEKISYTEMYRDSVYLTCEGELYKPEVIWSNQKVYIPAYNRMKRHLKFTGNRLVWDFKNATELKISQNIYDYVVFWWENCNQQLKTGKYELKILEDNFFSVLPIKSVAEKISYTDIYRDSVYLTCEGDLYKPEVIWKNMKVYSPAYERMRRHLKIESNRLTWDFTNAAELKISQNIYDYVTFMWNQDNEKLATGKYQIKMLENNYFSVFPIKSAGK